ncbi:MFS transporter [Thalassotalea profundi]|uniref:MFS transporter n=2 Tax=Thalassotalea profundi TaxID=2036687 RepID=A0ABQ3IR20_9GAMM|nr:MFS transporter [Thalassotalea profundi]
MANELGIVKTELYTAFSIALVVYSSLTYFVGKFMDGTHGVYVFPIGGVLAVISLIAWSMVSNANELYLVFIFIGISQSLLLYEPTFAYLVRLQSSDTAKKSIAFISVIAALSGSVYIPLVEVLIQSIGWRSALLTLALIIAFILVPIYLYLVSIDAKKATPIKKMTTVGLDKFALLTHKVFWAYVISLSMFSLTFSALASHLYPILLENNLSKDKAVFLLSIIGPAQLVGRLCFQRLHLTRPLSIIGLYTSGIILIAIATLLMDIKSISLLILMFITYGSCVGILITIKGLSALTITHSQYYGQVSGMMAIPILLSQALAPWLLAMIWNMHQSYSLPIYFLMAIMAIATVGFLYIEKASH